MSTGIQNYPNIEAPDSDYPNGNIKDKDISLPGTPVNKLVYADIHQTFAKLLREANITANGLPDNEYNGFQYLDALRIAARPYKSYAVNMSQSSTSDPTVALMEDQIGITSVTRQGVGDYLVNKTAGFGVSDTLVICSGSDLGTVHGKRVSPNAVNILTTDLAGVASDDILFVTSIEIRVYY